MKAIDEALVKAEEQVTKCTENAKRDQGTVDQFFVVKAYKILFQPVIVDQNNAIAKVFL